MSPSTNQTGTGEDRDWPTEAHKMVATKSKGTLAGIVAGMNDPDRARQYIEAELEVAQEEGREPRKDLVGALNRIIADAEADDDDQDVAADGGQVVVSLEDQDDDEAAAFGHQFLADHFRDLGDLRAWKRHLKKAKDARLRADRRAAGVGW